MLGFDRKAASYTWTAALVVLLLLLVYALRSTLFIFTLALLFAYLLSPLVNVLDRMLPSSRTRTPALALAYVIFVAVVVVIGIQIGSRVAEEARKFSRDFPVMIASWRTPAPEAPKAVNSLKAQIIDKIRLEFAKRSGDIVSQLPAAGVKLVSVASDLIFVVIIPILAFFFLKDGTEIRLHLLELTPEGPRRALLDDVMADAHLLLAHYMRALVVLSAAAFTAYLIFFTIIGLPYAVLLATVAGMLEFIPMVGPLAAVALVAIVAAVTNGPVLGVLIFIAIYRIIQDYVISPHLMGQGVEVHPLLVLFGVFAGAEIAGIPGTFLSVPVLALVRVIYVRMRKARLSARIAPAVMP